MSTGGEETQKCTRKGDMDRHKTRGKEYFYGQYHLIPGGVIGVN